MMFCPHVPQENQHTMFHHIQTFHVKSINDTSSKHIKPLWLSTASGGPIYEVECEIDAGAGCNVMPLYLHKSLFGDKSLTPTSVQIFGYGESPVANLGACTIAIHTGDRQQPQMATCQVTDTRGYLILRRETAQQVGYIAFVEVTPPSLTSTPQIHTSVNAQRRETVFWPGISDDVRNAVKLCDVCMKYKPAQQKEPLVPHDVPSLPWFKLGVDIFEYRSHRYLLVADYFS